MKYNKNKHRYILEQNDFEEETGELLEDRLINDNSKDAEGLADKFLNRVSKIFYNYIYSFNPANKLEKEYYLSEYAHPEYSEFIKEAMLEIAISMIDNASDKSSSYDYEKENKLDILAPLADAICISNGFTYRGKYVLPQDWKTHRGVDY